MLAATGGALGWRVTCSVTGRSVRGRLHCAPPTPTPPGTRGRVLLLALAADRRARPGLHAGRDPGRIPRDRGRRDPFGWWPALRLRPPQSVTPRCDSAGIGSMEMVDPDQARRLAAWVWWQACNRPSMPPGAAARDVRTAVGVSRAAAMNPSRGPGCRTGAGVTLTRRSRRWTRGTGARGDRTPQHRFGDRRDGGTGGAHLRRVPGRRRDHRWPALWPPVPRLSPTRSGTAPIRPIPRGRSLLPTHCAPRLGSSSRATVPWCASPCLG